jgi:hypothetical protein
MAIVVGFSMDSSFSVLLRLDDVGTTMPFHVMKEESTSSLAVEKRRSNRTVYILRGGVRAA